MTSQTSLSYLTHKYSVPKVNMSLKSNDLTDIWRIICDILNDLELKYLKFIEFLLPLLCPTAGLLPANLSLIRRQIYPCYKHKHTSTWGYLYNVLKWLMSCLFYAYTGATLTRHIDLFYGQRRHKTLCFLIIFKRIDFMEHSTVVKSNQHFTWTPLWLFPYLQSPVSGIHFCVPFAR